MYNFHCERRSTEGFKWALVEKSLTEYGDRKRCQRYVFLVSKDTMKKWFLQNNIDCYKAGEWKQSFNKGMLLGRELFTFLPNIILLREALCKTTWLAWQAKRKWEERTHLQM